VTNPLEEIAKVVREADRLLLVDAISSLGAIPCDMDGWGLDVVVTGSQKGWMVPPGLAFIALSERGWQAYESARMPRFYMDVAKARDFLQKGQTPWTPTISVYFGLDVALEKMAAEGLEGVHARHARIGQMVREGVKALGLELLATDERYASDTVTAIKCPEGVEVAALRRMLEDEHGVVMAGAQAKLAGKAFRIGHLGLVSEEDIRHALDALAKVLPKVGYTMPTSR
jgi:aspartate aminotransferase-like enzyme